MIAIVLQENHTTKSGCNMLQSSLILCIFLQGRPMGGVLDCPLQIFKTSQIASLLQSIQT